MTRNNTTANEKYFLKDIISTTVLSLSFLLRQHLASLSVK